MNASGQFFSYSKTLQPIWWFAAISAAALQTSLMSPDAA